MRSLQWKWTKLAAKNGWTNHFNTKSEHKKRNKSSFATTTTESWWFICKKNTYGPWGSMKSLNIFLPSARLSLSLINILYKKKSDPWRNWWSHWSTKSTQRNDNRRIVPIKIRISTQTCRIHRRFFVQNTVQHRSRYEVGANKISHSKYIGISSEVLRWQTDGISSVRLSKSIRTGRTDRISTLASSVMSKGLELGRTCPMDLLRLPSSIQTTKIESCFIQRL